MPFSYATSPDPSLTGADLRGARGKHDILATGASRRLAQLLPKHVKDNETAAAAPHRLGIWLSFACLGLAKDAKDLAFYASKIGVQRMGAAVDKAIAKVEGKNPIPVEVLRGQLKRTAAAGRLAGEPEYIAVTASRGLRVDVRG